jgi:hypothetical protein
LAEARNKIKALENAGDALASTSQNKDAIKEWVKTKNL